MPRPLFTSRKDPVPIVQEAGWTPGPVWTGAGNLAPTGIRSPDRPAVTSRYTDYATPPTQNIKPHIKFWVFLEQITLECRKNKSSNSNNVSSLHVGFVMCGCFGNMYTVLSQRVFHAFSSVVRQMPG